jgi:hypothetical protein
MASKVKRGAAHLVAARDDESRAADSGLDTASSANAGVHTSGTVASRGASAVNGVSAVLISGKGALKTASARSRQSSADAVSAAHGAPALEVADDDEPVDAQRSEGRPSKRQRRPPTRFEEPQGTGHEAKMLAVALELSRAQPGAASRAAHVPDAPVLRPSVEEWADPCAYIASIQEEAQAFGVCKIVPPRGWAPPDTWPGRARSNVRYTTRAQAVHRLAEGLPFPDGPAHTAAGYRAMADEFKRTQ